MSIARRLGLEEGETLLEILIAVAIMGIAVAAILGLFQSSITASSIHKQQSVAGSILDNYAEFMQSSSTAPFSPCPTALTAYATDKAAFVTAMSTPGSAVYEADASKYNLGLAVTQGVYGAAGSDPAVTYPDPATSPACATAANGDDPRTVQQVTLTVTSTDSEVSESVQLVRWRP